MVVNNRSTVAMKRKSPTNIDNNVDNNNIPPANTTTNENRSKSSSIKGFGFWKVERRKRPTIGILLIVVGSIIMIWNFRRFQILLGSINDDDDDGTHILLLNPKKSNKKFKSTSSGGRGSQNDGSSSNKLAGLNCDKYGGPSSSDSSSSSNSKSAVEEMVYWRDIPVDSNYTSPYANYGPNPKYLTFEPDEGGFNNLRMSMETATVLAHIMGRVLVLPPVQPIYLLWNDPKNKNNRFTFADFFPFQDIQSEHPAGEVISMEEFLKREIPLTDQNTGNIVYPPGTDFDDHGQGSKGWKGFRNVLDKQRKLWLWLRNVTSAPIWNFDNCIVGIGKEPGSVGIKRMEDLHHSIQFIKPWKTQQYNNNPTPVNASIQERMQELLGDRRRELCIFNEKLQTSKVIHFMGDNDSGARLLTHFYTYLLLEDWHQDLWVKRFVRDHLRYKDSIQCSAARIVQGMREKAIANGNPDGVYDSFHIRRGDFQYKQTRIEADEIYNNVADVLVENSTIFIATDERNMTFFNPLRDHYHIYFLHDFMDQIVDVNKNLYGMLDQLVASKGRTFIGTFFSTFTGYINRIRGYHAQKDKLPGYELGRINSYIYVPKDIKYDMRRYRSVRTPMWAREFPIGWRDIDKDLLESQIFG